KETELGEMEKLLRMNDAWGTHRGIMWLRSFDIFADANPWQKLFGTGPDTFYFAFEKYFEQLAEYGNSSTDAAHNEYINYLITIGIAGLGSYLAFAGGALVRGFKAAKRNPAVLCCAAAVVAYLAQATVNIALPISTPLFIVFVSLCEAFAENRAQAE
ncbi:MAG: O-antigen ligase family protein, partial [Ruminococcus sp.]|nr:O-antigen ligase family protein [Ruminococcus sp.]